MRLSFKLAKVLLFRRKLVFICDSIKVFFKVVNVIFSDSCSYYKDKNDKPPSLLVTIDNNYTI